MWRKVDSNQSEIVRALRDVGASVLSLSPMGRGCPDLLVGWLGVNYLVEVKNLEGHGDKLTPDEDTFIQCWRGRIYIVNTVDEALALLGMK